MTTGEIAILCSTIIGSAGIMGVIVTGWVKVNVKIAAIQAELADVKKDVIKNEKDLERHKVDSKQDNIRIYDKLGEVLDGVNEVKLQLKDKADKQ